MSFAISSLLNILALNTGDLSSMFFIVTLLTYIFIKCKEKKNRPIKEKKEGK